MPLLHHATTALAGLADNLVKHCQESGMDLGPIPAALGVNLGGDQSGLAFSVIIDGVTHTVVVVPFEFDGVPE
jgi:hypothetical protein